MPARIADRRSRPQARGCAHGAAEGRCGARPAAARVGRLRFQRYHPRNRRCRAARGFARRRSRRAARDARRRTARPCDRRGTRHLGRAVPRDEAAARRGARRPRPTARGAVPACRRPEAVDLRVARGHAGPDRGDRAGVQRKPRRGEASRQELPFFTDPDGLREPRVRRHRRGAAVACRREEARRTHRRQDRRLRLGEVARAAAVVHGERVYAGACAVEVRAA